MRKYINVAIFTLFSLAVVLFTDILDSRVFADLSVSAALGFSVLAALCGISKYNSLIPGIVIGATIGAIEGGGPGVIIEVVPLLIAMLYYRKLLSSNPLSPLNVYKSSALGIFSHVVVSFFWFRFSWQHAFIELIVALLVVKSIVNILREEGLINHEDPKLVAKLERDYLSMFYGEINKIFKTNLQRPIKPRKGEN